MDATGLWFSKLEREYLSDYGKFTWTDDQRIWDWSDLTTVDLVRTRDGTKKLILRRGKEIFTEHGRPGKTGNGKAGTGKADAVKAGTEEKEKTNAYLRYMLGIDIDDEVGGIKTDYYTAKIYDHKNKSWSLKGPKKRWSFQVGDNAWLWQWADDGSGSSGSPLNAKIGEVHKHITGILSTDNVEYTNIFDLGVKKDHQCRPVIYQPAVDGTKNFVREIHWHKKPELDGKKEYEVTIIFNNEELRKHKMLNWIYEHVREAKYGRLNDIETFVIMGDSKNDNANGLRFTKIYSGYNNLEEDTIHGDVEEDIPPHRVRYYADDHNHPVIFVNTSNHAMAEHDTNPDLWKWEYISWMDDGPFLKGEDCRDKVNQRYKGYRARIIKDIAKLLD